MSPDGGLSGADALISSAHDTGQRIWLAYPAKRRQIILDHGYTKVELKGTLISGFEISSFSEFPAKAARSKSGAIGINMESWRERNFWALYMFGCKDDIGFRSMRRKTGFHRSHKVNARISAWRSPWEGGYGHMNMWPRQLYITKISPLRRSKH